MNKTSEALSSITLAVFFSPAIRDQSKVSVLIVFTQIKGSVKEIEDMREN